MPNIEINTAQNVKIEYELASLGQRIFAYIIDFFIMGFVMVIFIISVLSNGDDYESIKTSELVIQVFAFLWFGFYTLISEVLGNGQTIGKKAMGIKVIKINGQEPEFYDYFSRWSLRMVDIYLSVGTIALFLIASNKNGQRIGDIVAGTSIIRKRSSYGFSLNDILKLNLRKKEEYEFQYPNVSKLAEKDVILIKNLIFRSRQFDNESHREAMNNMVYKLCQILELPTIPRDKEAFLNTIISEYIIHTR